QSSGAVAEPLAVRPDLYVLVAGHHVGRARLRFVREPCSRIIRAVPLQASRDRNMLQTPHERISLMKVRIVAALLVVGTFGCAGIAFAADENYKAGKIVKVEKQEPRTPSGGTDAPTKPDLVNYHISIQIGDKLYTCLYKVYMGRDLEWVEGKDVQA